MSDTRTIDDAWREAEQRLGEWWRIRSCTELPDDAWEAVATDGRRIAIGQGVSLIDALDALASPRDSDG